MAPSAMPLLVDICALGGRISFGASVAVGVVGMFDCWVGETDPPAAAVCVAAAISAVLVSSRAGVAPSMVGVKVARDTFGEALGLLARVPRIMPLDLSLPPP